MEHPSQLPSTADLIREGEKIRARLRREKCACITCHRQLKQAESLLALLRRMENTERLAVLS